MPKTRILVVEDESIVARDIKKTLEGFGYEVPCLAATGDDAVRKAGEHRPDLVLMDVMLRGDMDGVEAAGRITSRFDIPIVYLTSYSDEAILERARLTGPFGYIIKPFDDKELQITVMMACYKAESEKKMKLLSEQLEQSNRELEASRVSFHNIVEKDSSGIVVTYKNGIVSYVNPAARKIFNRENDELVGEQFGIPITVSDTAMEVDIIRKGGTVGTGDVQTIETEWEGKSAYLLLINDITERKEYEQSLIRTAEELKKQQRRLTAEIAARAESDRIISKILESVDEGFIIIDRDYRIIKANQSFARQAGMAVEEVTGRHCYEVSHHVSAPCSEQGEDCAVEHVFRTGQPHISVHNHYDAITQKSSFIETKAYPFTTDSSGTVTEALETHIDITERKLYEESLRKTAEELKRIDEMKTNFIAIASHELRTPLTTIKGAVDVLVKGKAGATTGMQDKFLRMAEENVNRLGALINGLLDVSRIESGKLELQRGEVDMGAVVQAVLGMLQQLADKKSIALRSVVSADLPRVYADEQKIEQVLVNLVGNALKFTPDSGSVVIDAHPALATPEGGENAKRYLEIAVADTGVGIPDEQQEHVFEKFFQSESSLVRDQAGTGLGLVITKGIVEAHGGKIWFESTAGGGSTFFFTVPVFDDRENALRLLEDELALAKQNHSPLSVVLLGPAGPVGGDNGCETPRFEYTVVALQEKAASGLFRSNDRVFVVPLDQTAALILANMDRVTAQGAVSRIRRNLLGGMGPGEGGLSLTAQAIVTYPEDGTTAEELLANAQKAATGGR